VKSTRGACSRVGRAASSIWKKSSSLNPNIEAITFEGTDWTRSLYSRTLSL
jgi:hypothetical protein